MRQGQAECKAQGETLYLSLGASWRYSHRQVREERNEFQEGQAQNSGDKYTQRVKIKVFEASETTANYQFLPNNKPNFFTYNQVIVVVCVP